jgi:hypothetical protein
MADEMEAAMRPGYPTLWDPEAQRRPNGTYAGIISRLKSPTSGDRAACAHPHLRMSEALACAQRSAGIKNRERPR